MKTKRFLLLSVLLVVLLSGVKGQSPHFDTSPEYDDDEQAGDYNTISATSVNHEDYSSDVDLNSENSYSMFDDNFATIGLETQINRTTTIVNLPLQYGFNVNLIKNKKIKQRITIKGTFPLARKNYEISWSDDPKTFTATGLGDITLMGRYSLTYKKLYLSARLSAKLPTGKIENSFTYTYNNNDYEILIPLGSGSTDIGMLCSARRAFANIAVNANIGYYVLTSYTYDDIEYDFGNQFMFSTRATYTKFKKFTGGLNLSYFSAAYTETTWQRVTTNEGPEIRLLDIAPFVKIALPFNSSVEFKLAVPVVTKFDNLGYDIENSTRGIKAGVKFRIYIFSLKAK